MNAEFFALAFLAALNPKLFEAVLHQTLRALGQFMNIFLGFENGPRRGFATGRLPIKDQAKVDGTIGALG